ncbi:MAG TPA: hypothetical protein EYM32_08810 [Dehalococcoidia bacterium]|nr:hypothetical protein [Dehalococcoidia bacterium]HIM48959.1 hypothetical protein [Dehalococcoidia bacterium]
MASLDREQTPVSSICHRESQRIRSAESTLRTPAITECRCSTPPVGGWARSEAKGSGLGSSKKPSSIGLDSSGNGYVVDTENHRIQVSRCAITGRSGGGRVVGAGAAI